MCTLLYMFVTGQKYSHTRNGMPTGRLADHRSATHRTRSERAGCKSKRHKRPQSDGSRLRAIAAFDLFAHRCRGHLVTSPLFSRVPLLMAAGQKAAGPRRTAAVGIREWFSIPRSPGLIAGHLSAMWKRCMYPPVGPGLFVSAFSAGAAMTRESVLASLQFINLPRCFSNAFCARVRPNFAVRTFYVRSVLCRWSAMLALVRN